MSAISLKSITGITSITTPAGVDNQLTLHTNNTTERVKITAEGNVHINNHLAVLGVSTHNDHVQIIDGKRLKVGSADNGDLILLHTGTDSIIDNATGNLFYRSATHKLQALNAEDMIVCNTNGAVELYHDNIKRFETTNQGINIIGHSELDNVSIAGVTTFSGNVNITNTNPKLFFYDTNNDSDYAIVNNGGVFRINDETNSLNRFSIDSNGNVSILKDLDVDGHTELDNVRIVGIVTTSNLTVASNQILGHGNSTGNQIKFTRSGLGDELVIGTDGYGNSTQYEATIQSSIVTPRPLVFATGNTERFRIEGGGDLKFNNADSIIHTGADTSRFRIFGGSTNSTTNGAALALHGVNHSSGNYAVLAAGNGGFIKLSTGTTEVVRIQSTGVVNIGDTVATSQNDRLLQIGKTNRGATYLELRTSTSGVGGIVLSDGTGGGNEGYRGTIEYVHNGDYLLFKTAASERLRINNEGALSVQTTLTGNNAILYLNNKRTRASGHKYGIEFRDNNNEANANIVIQQNSSGNNASEMQFYMNGGTGGNGLQNGNHTLRLQQSGDVQIPTGNLNFRTLSSSPAQAAPASINLGGTHSNAAGNGTNLNAKLKVWSDGTDMMGFSVSSNQLDHIVTQEVYDFVWYGGNSGTSELMRLEGDGDLILTNGNKLNINAAQAAGQYGALLNIGWDSGTNIATRAIDIGGGWSAGENKRITFSHSTGSNNLVGEINSVHYGGTPSRTVPHSGMRFGKLYHGNDSTTFTMTLDSTSTTTADLNLKGAYRSTEHPAFSLDADGGQSNIGTSATKITYSSSPTIGRNQSSCYDTTNHRFVAPVDGMYHFYARHWFVPNASGTVTLLLYRNGSQIKESRFSSGSNGDYNTVQLSTTIFLSASNYVEIYGVSSSGSNFHVSSGSFHTEFSGFMVC